MKNLQLSLKRQWFEMTKAGIKTEDYREINEYWFKRLFRTTEYEEMEIAIQNMKIGYSINAIGMWHLYFLKDFDTTTITLGYPKSTDSDRILKLEHKGIEIGYGKEEWGAEPNKLYFIIKHGQEVKQELDNLKN